MYIGDAEQNASGIIPSAVKGSLRFWWRAVNWSRFLTEAEGDENQALRFLHRYEAALFGSTAENHEADEPPRGGQGAFLLRVTSEALKKCSASELDHHKDYNLTGNKWQSYLLGLGLMEYRREQQANFYLRGAIVSGSFTLTLHCRNADYVQELKALLLLWGLLGGLGSRQRKGFGSISISKLTVGKESQALPASEEQYKATLAKLLNANNCSGEPPYTALSGLSRLIISQKSNKPAWGQLGELAQHQQMYRGWGYKTDVHRINRERADHHAYGSKEADHVLVCNLARHRIPPEELPSNIVFGLPRTYTLSSEPKREITLEAFARDGEGNPDSRNKRSRRASPLFIHLHEFDDGECSVLQLFMPSRFLPQHDVVKLKRKNGEFEIPLPEPTDWQVIEEYLSGHAPPKWQELKHGG